jgi:hypothetical protein
MKPFPTILTAIILIAASFFLGKCSGYDKAEPDTAVLDKIDSLNLIAQINADRIKALNGTIQEQSKDIDSLKSVKPKREIRYVQAKRSFTAEDSLNCPETMDKVNILIAASDSLHALNDSIIAGHVTLDSTYIELIRTQENQIAVKDTVNQILTDELSKQTEKVGKLEKKVKRNRIIAACSAAVAAVMAVF